MQMSYSCIDRNECVLFIEKLARLRWQLCQSMIRVERLHLSSRLLVEAQLEKVSRDDQNRRDAIADIVQRQQRVSTLSHSKAEKLAKLGHSVLHNQARSKGVLSRNTLSVPPLPRTSVVVVHW